LKLGYDSPGRNPADPLRIELREPEIPVRAGNDCDHPSPGRGQGKLSYDARRRDPADPVVVLREPEIPIRTSGDRSWSAPGRRERKLRDGLRGNGRGQNEKYDKRQQ
jgi:hypothetical protein